MLTIDPSDYAVLLADIKARVQSAQTRAIFAVNAEALTLYWDVGAMLEVRQRQAGWGAGVIPKLARDLHNEMPELKGFSERNIGRMLAFHRAYRGLVLPPAVAKSQGKVLPPPVAKMSIPRAGDANPLAGNDEIPTELLLAVPWAHHHVLLEKVKDAAVRRWYMERLITHGWSRSMLQEELERMGRLVADLLFLAKAERGAGVLRRERFPAAREVQALLEFYDALAEDRGLRLRTTGDAEIDGDRAMFRRAVSNLLSNAVRHADPGSEVTVAVETTEREARIAVENVADDLEADVLPRLFDRFYRADPARRHPASEGAGLGLSITKAIVEAHGGRMEASSAGRWVRFTMHFPLGEDWALQSSFVAEPARPARPNDPMGRR